MLNGAVTIITNGVTPPFEALNGAVSFSSIITARYCNDDDITIITILIIIMMSDNNNNNDNNVR